MNTIQKLRSFKYVKSLSDRSFSVSDSIQLNNTPDTLWSFVSNTDVINSKVGLGPTKNSFNTTAEGNTEMSVEFKELGMTMAYEELPYEWTAPHHFQVERIFKKGPLLYLSFIVDLKLTSQNTTELHATLKFVPRFAGFIFKKIMNQNLKKILDVYLEIDKKVTPRPPIGPEAFLEPVEKYKTQIVSLVKFWKSFSTNEKLITSLAEFIYTAPARYVNKLRPFELAKIYDLDKMETLRFCLLATKKGYLDMSWDLLCPSCKGAKERNEKLEDINGEAHCDSCGIDYSLRFDENVELTFSPAPKVRLVTTNAFCAGSPANTAHILSQKNFWPDSQQDITLDLRPGRYRFRSLSMDGTQEFEVVEGASRVYKLDLKKKLIGEPELLLTSPLTLKANNTANYMQTLKVEKMAWKDNIVTAAQVSAIQDFRDMFGSEVLQPGLELAISNLVVLFTDLKDSTWIYDTRGDAPAFSLVKEHFNMLLPILRDHDGALVKTIGDAIMGVFQTELQTIQACFEIQRQFKEFNQGKSPEKQAIIKIGFHMGPCIALNLNDKLDYFGATVNKAARIQGKSVGDDICMTDEIYHLPDIQNFLKQHPHQVESFSATLKGIAGESTIYKVTPVFS